VRVRARACPGAYASVHVALVIQHATRMNHTVTPFVALLAQPQFSKLSYDTIFEKRSY
jgi:hypothetical protein